MHADPDVVDLDAPTATDVGRVGAKAANLARARRHRLPVLDGVVLTTSWSPDRREQATAAWRRVSLDGTRPVVVRSSSTGEDGDRSSMAGVFESVLRVVDEASFHAAVRRVLASAASARESGLVDARMAVLVQPMLDPRWGGVLFGADPVTGRRDRLVVAAVPGGPDGLVSGTVEGWTAVLDRRGGLREVRSAAGAALPSAHRRALARLARAAHAAFGGPQDIEWAIDPDGRVVLLQARPITSLPAVAGPVFGPGPVAESFPDALGPLEQDLWIEPLRSGLREALRLSGAASTNAIERSAVVIAVDGIVAADLDLLHGGSSRRGVLARLDPRPPARRLRAAWRVGRLRAALPSLAEDAVRSVDAQLLAVPGLHELSNAELLAILGNGRDTLAALHGHEALAGLLIPNAAAAGVTGASLALSVLAQAAAEDVEWDDLVEREPVVLALLPPRVGPTPALVPAVDAPVGPSTPSADDLDPAAVAREALRLRIRWLHELTARAAWELGRRLVDVGVLPSHAAVRMLRLEELHEAAIRRRIPSDLGGRREPAGPPLPGRFRLADDGRAVAEQAPERRRRRREALAATGSRAVGAGGGVSRGEVAHDAAAVAAGSVLVVPTLDPRLAPVIPRLSGLVAETGNALSHLAILAREHGVPVVVGLVGATSAFPAGAQVIVDGQTGTVERVDRAGLVSEGAAA